MQVSSSSFEFSASAIISRTPGLAKEGKLRKFRSLFGVSPSSCAHIWNFLGSSKPSESRPVHLLWALLFLKVYATEHVHSVITGVDEKTFRFWSWRFVRLISNLSVIRWESRYDGRMYSGCRVSVDGTDCRIFEPTPFSSKWFSHKFKGPGIRYEVGICIETGLVVWVHGPFPCKNFPDLTVFRLALKHALDDNEQAVADGGYRDEKCRNPREVLGFERFDSIVRARHETVNRRLKQFFVLSHRFRHQLSLHSCCFHAVANIVQVSLQNGEPLFDVDSVDH